MQVLFTSGVLSDLVLFDTVVLTEDKFGLAFLTLANTYCTSATYMHGCVCGCGLDHAGLHWPSRGPVLLYNAEQLLSCVLAINLALYYEQVQPLRLLQVLYISREPNMTRI